MYDELITHALTSSPTPQTFRTDGPTPKQADLLRSLGYTGPIDSLSSADTKDLIDQLLAAKKQWRDQAKAQAGEVNLIALAEQYTTLRRESSREFSAPCPKCGGTKRFHVKADGWFCRDCHPEWGDSIEFVRFISGCSFEEALTRLTGGSLPAAPTVTPRANVAKPGQSEEWLRKATGLLVDAQKALILPEGKQGRVFLSKRGLSLATARLFGLGYIAEASLPGSWNHETKQASYPKQPAIVIPWFHGGKLVGLRYRFLQWHTYQDAKGADRKEKQGAVTGSTFAGLWGEQCHGNGGEVLIICEGEINAASICQAMAGGVDVASTGSESTAITTGIVALTQQYERVVFWADRRAIVEKQTRHLPGAWGYVSPDGRDANDLLQAGELAELVNRLATSDQGLIEPIERREPGAVLNVYGLA